MLKNIYFLLTAVVDRWVHSNVLPVSFFGPINLQGRKKLRGLFPKSKIETFCIRNRIGKFFKFNAKIAKIKKVVRNLSPFKLKGGI